MEYEHGQRECAAGAVHMRIEAARRHDAVAWSSERVLAARGAAGQK